MGGSDGVIINFEEAAPPEEVYDGGDFPFGVVVNLKNEGEFDVPKEDIDVVLFYSSRKELKFIQNDFGVVHKIITYNFFIIVWSSSKHH